MMCFLILSKLKKISEMMYDVFCDTVKVKKISKMMMYDVFCDEVKLYLENNY